MTTLKKWRTPFKTLNFIQMHSSDEHCKHDPTKYSCLMSRLRPGVTIKTKSVDFGTCFTFFFTLIAIRPAAPLSVVYTEVKMLNVFLEPLSQLMDNLFSLWIFWFLSPDLKKNVNLPFWFCHIWYNKNACILVPVLGNWSYKILLFYTLLSLLIYVWGLNLCLFKVDDLATSL